MVCIDDEIPFEIPLTWAWVRLNFVSIIARGSSPRPIKDYLTDSLDGINWIKIGDTEKDGMYINSTKEKITVEGLSKSRLVHKGDFLLTNSMSFGRPYITNVDGCIHDGWLVISPIGTSFKQKFLYYLLSSGYAFSQFAGKVSGAVVKNLNSDKVAGVMFPLPPYNEQQRILDKLDVLVPKINTYGIMSDAIYDMNTSLRSKLRKSILQEAIQGKLVPQDPNDEPASVLLQQIREEKQRLVKEGKLKKKDIVDSIIYKGDDNKYYEQVDGETVDITEEIPFDIPEGWVWCRLKSICSIFTGATFKKEDSRTDQKGIRILRGGNILPFKITFNADDIFLSPNFVKENILLKRNDIVTPAVTSLENVGKMARIKDNLIDVTVGGFVFVLRLYYSDDWLSQYLLAVMSSPRIIEYIKSITNKSGQAFYNIGKERLGTTLLPLPPHCEQQRIVSKVEDLLGAINTIVGGL